jgi:cobalt-zinc-cadmium efflux system outer membrane protein
MPRQYLLWLLSLLVLAGCHAPVQQHVDGLLCGRANDLLDPTPPGARASQMPYATSKEPAARDEGDPALRQTSAQKPAQKDETLPTPRPKVKLGFVERLTVPLAEVPGAAPPFKIPPWEKKPTPAYRAAIDKYFPPLPDVGPNPGPQPSPTGQPLTLADLQKLAFTNSPLLRQAASDVEAALGAFIQAGAYPNPALAYQASSQSTSGGPMYGGSVQQTIKTMGKLKLAQAAAQMDLENARLAYRRAETDLMATVRGGYFAVLVAQENIRANRALVRLTDEVYKVMVENARAGGAAPYEPTQLAVFAAQARAGLITARNSYTLAWRQLAASLGLPGMPPTELAGRIDLPLPLYRFDQALAYVLANHTDVKTAENGILKARYNLRAAEVVAVPDVTVAGTFLDDMNPAGPASIAASVSVGLTVPVWDLNKGAIRQAQAALMRANEEPHRVRDDLSGRVADAFRRYDENRDILELNRKDILPKQIQALRGAVERYYAEPAAVAYTDLVTAEQNLVAVIGPYMSTLGAMWQAVTDLASLLQTDDLFQVASGQLPVPPLADLEHLLELPCRHLCSPLPQPGLRQADLAWPPAGFGPAGQPAAPRGTMPPAEMPPARALLMPPEGAAPVR